MPLFNCPKETSSSLKALSIVRFIHGRARTNGWNSRMICIRRVVVVGGDRPGRRQLPPPRNLIDHRRLSSSILALHFAFHGSKLAVLVTLIFIAFNYEVPRWNLNFISVLSLALAEKRNTKRERVKCTQWIYFKSVFIISFELKASSRISSEFWFFYIIKRFARQTSHISFLVFYARMVLLKNYLLAKLIFRTIYGRSIFFVEDTWFAPKSL